MLVDTHAHIHFAEFDGDVDDVIARAEEAGVRRIICVGTGDEDSAKAVEFVQRRDNCWATVGLHPHDASKGEPALRAIAALATRPKVVAVGECGLDYYRDLSPREDQERALRFQIELALDNDLALVFHVREAFPDFFRITKDYPIKRAVVHCFTAGTPELEQALASDFYIALNGIMTFTKDPSQLLAAKHVPLDRLVLETDCPFLSPVPFRGQRNEPALIKETAQFLSTLRGESLSELSKVTTSNTQTLFKLP